MRYIMVCLWLVVGTGAAACSDSSVELPVAAESADVSFELKLREELDYPLYLEEGGPEVCALYDVVVGGDEDGAVRIEAYDFDLLNSELSAAPEQQSVAQELGIERVETCEDARRFSAGRLEAAERRPSLGLPAVEDSAPRPLKEAQEDVGSQRALNIYDDGTPFNYGPTLRVVIWSGPGWNQYDSCSGFAISSNAILTSAHCIYQSGRRPVRVYRYDISGGSGVCVYPDCSSLPGGGTNAMTYRHQNYSGLGDPGDDIGLIVMDDPFPSEMSFSGYWLRLAEDTPSVGHNVLGTGWSSNGSGSRKERITAGYPTIDYVGTRYFLWDTNANEGRLCEGDSGGPGVNSSVTSYEIAFGINSEVSEMSGICAGIDGVNRLTSTGPHIGWIEDKIGSCNSYTSGGFDYVRCW